MRLLVLALVSFLLASCGQGVDQGDNAGRERDSRPETLEWTDGKGDMWAAKFAEDSSFVASEPRPTSTNGDIRHVAVAHRRRRAGDQGSVPGPGRRRNASVPLRAFVDTNMGIKNEISVAWEGPAQEAVVNIVTEDMHIDCEAASSNVDFEDNTASVRVPRSCLGLPRWVRVSLESEILQSKNYQAEPAHMDSAMDAGFPANIRQDGTLVERALSERVYANAPSSASGRGETTSFLPDPRGDVVRIGAEADEFSEGSSGAATEGRGHSQHQGGAHSHATAHPRGVR